MANPSSASEMEAAVQRTLNQTKPGEDEHRQRTKRYDKAYDVYRASEPRPASLEPWQSKLRVPFGMQVINTAMVNLVSGKPRCKVLPRTPDYTGNAKAFQKVMDYHVDRDHLVEKVPDVVLQGLIYGVTAGKNNWLFRESQKVKKVYGPDGRVAGYQPQNVTLFDGPSFEPWDVYDLWWDPNGRNVDTCSWVCLRSFVSKDYLLQNECKVKGEHNPWECDGLYHNVDLCIEAGSSRRQETTSQERFLGGNDNLRKDSFEIREYWNDDKLVVIGANKVLLRECPNPHWHGKKPVVIASTQPDLFKVQGIPETELVDHLQQALWTVANMRMDQMHLTVMRGFTYREGGVTDPKSLVLRPRFMWPVVDHDDIRPVDVQPLPPEAYRESQELLGLMQHVTGITPYISGAANSAGMDNTTATTTSIMNEVASRLLRFKAQQIHYQIWQRTFEQWGDDVQQFMDEPVWVRLEGPGGKIEHEQVDPQKVAGDFEFVLQGTEESLSKQTERSEALGLLNALAPLAQTGMVNFKPLLERVAETFNFDNPEELFQPQPQQAPPAAPVPQQGQPQPPQQLSHGAVMNPMVANAITAGR